MDMPEEKLAALMAAWTLFLRTASDPRDPYPQLARAREATPVLLEDVDGHPTALVFPHEEVATVLRDAGTFSSSILSEGVGRSSGERIVVSMDDPDHRRHRALISHAFRPRAMASWEEHVLPGLAHALIQRFNRDGRAELDGGGLGDDNIYAFVRMLLPAGVETTFRSLGNVLFLLLTHAEVLDAVRADRSVLPAVIEETLRLEVPMLITSRVAARDTGLRDVKMPAGASVTAVIGAANRDETRWANPDRFDPFRDPAPHISFGQGAHLCLGMHLARAEARVAVDALLDALPQLRLDSDASETPHIRGQVFRSPTALPVRF